MKLTQEMPREREGGGEGEGEWRDCKGRGRVGEGVSHPLAGQVAITPKMAA